MIVVQGGYNLESISNSALAVTKVLLGDPLPPLPPLSPSEAALETVWEVGMAQSPYWECMAPRVPAPRKGRFNSLPLINYPDVCCIEALSDRRSHWTVRFVGSVLLSPELTMLSQEILNKHRAESLFATHNIIQVPLPVQEPSLRGGQLALSYAANISTISTFSFV